MKHDDHALNITEDQIPRNKFRVKFMGFKKKVGIPYPYALGLEEWDVWRAETKLKMPIRWWILETVPDFFNKLFVFKVKFLCSKYYWLFMHTFVRKHQYNIIRPRTLPPSYYDARDLILHGSMEILCDFVEHQNKHGIVAWDADEGHQHVWDEANIIYDWWNDKYLKREEALDEKFPLPATDDTKPMLWIFYSTYEDTDEALEYKKILSLRREEEETWEAEEEDMLIRLAKIRLALWD